MYLKQMKGDWIDGSRNLLITGGAGAGKTHVANALCVTALHQMHTVKYIRANRLLRECEKARDEGRVYDYTNAMYAYDLLVIDDFGLMDLDIDKCLVLFEIVESRDSRKPTVIISSCLSPSGGTYLAIILTQMPASAG